MRIAQLAPLYEAVPPQKYGGTERVVAALCDGLADRGHDVTLFAAGESMTRARLHEAVAAPLRTRMTKQELIDVAPHIHLRMLADLYRDADFDVIHSHLDIWTMPFAAMVDVPSVMTMHGRLDLPMLRKILRMYPQPPLVSISDHQRHPVDDLDLNWVATVPHGLALDRYLEHPRSADRHLAFVGCRLRRTSVPREGCRHGDRRCPALRFAAAHRRQGRSDGRRVLRRLDRATPRSGHAVRR